MLVCFASFIGCARPPAPVEDPNGSRDVSRFSLTDIRGTRDGERLIVRAIYGDGTRELALDLHFKVGVPTKLQAGTWSGLGANGIVRERSVTFLGGQSGPPSIGGRFDLLGPGGRLEYRINIPVQPVERRLSP
jgi:hypothetical protein